jgi:hypothetical protein
MIIEESEWWLRALFGERPPIHEDTPPQAGWYMRRLVPRGPFVPARIYLEEYRDEVGELLCDVVYCCEVNGRREDAFDQWLYLAKYPISRDRYQEMINEGICDRVGEIAG